MNVAANEIRDELWKTIIELQDNIKTIQSLTNNNNFEEDLIEKSLQEFHFSIQDIKPLNLLKQQLIQKKKEDKPTITNHQVFPIPSSTALIHYGVEIRHLPLCQHLSGASKYITSSNWFLAREEMKFSKFFERVLELKQIGSWSPSIEIEIKNILKENTFWDDCLNEILFLSKEFKEEKKWKILLSKCLAEEAVDFLKLKKSSFSRNNSFNGPFFYQPTKEIFISTPFVNSSNYSNQHHQFEPLKLISNHSNTAAAAITSLQNNISVAIKEEIPILEDNSNKNSKKIEWTNIEDHFLLKIFEKIPLGIPSITFTINLSFHGGRLVRTDSDILHRLSKLSSSLQSLDDSYLKSGNIDKKDFLHHLARMQHMNHSLTKLISPKPSGHMKKISMSAHPSHEAAARKANQNISKLFTPQELAMRRIQRSRMVSEMGPGFMLSGNSNVARPTSTAVPTQPQRPPALPQHMTYTQQTMPLSTPNVPQGVQYGQMASNLPMAANSGSVPMAALARPPPTRPPGLVITNAAITQQQQRQALLNRSHQIGSYISTMSHKQSPSMRPPIPHNIPGATSAYANNPQVNVPMKRASPAPQDTDLSMSPRKKPTAFPPHKPQ